MPLFMLKKEVFALVKSGKKNVEVRKADGPWKNTKAGDTATIACGPERISKKVKAVHKGTLENILSKVDYQRADPEAKSKDAAVKALKALNPDAKDFVAYELS